MLDALPSPKVQYVKYITDTAHAGCRKIFEEKKAALKSGDQEALLKVGEGKDVMSVLRELVDRKADRSRFLTELFIVRENLKASEEDKLPDEEVLAQMG